MIIRNLQLFMKIRPRSEGGTDRGDFSPFDFPRFFFRAFVRFSVRAETVPSCRQSGFFFFFSFMFPGAGAEVRLGFSFGRYSPRGASGSCFCGGLA